MSWWNHSPCSSLISPQLFRNLSNSQGKKWTLILILVPISCRIFNSFSTNSMLFLAWWMPKKIFTMVTNYVLECNSKPFIELKNSSSLLSFLMLWWNHFHHVHHVLSDMYVCYFLWWRNVFLRVCVILSLIVVVNKGGWRSKKTKMPFGFIWRFLMAAWNKEFTFMLQVS